MGIVRIVRIPLEDIIAEHIKIEKSNEKAMDRNLSNQKTNPTFKTKMGNH